jgi:organic hydroperoxide reductase OsmC/OhrA
MEGKEIITTVELSKDHEFRVKFDIENVGELIVDEPPPLGRSAGPNASRLLSAAVGNCLSASLLFCMRKAKVEVNKLKTVVRTSLARNSEGYWRVSHIKVKIEPEINLEDTSGFKRCLEIFERYCVVTQSVREGIDVKVEVEQ